MAMGYECPNANCEGKKVTGGRTLHYSHKVGTVYYYKCDYCGTVVTENYPYDEDDVSDSDD